MRKVSNLAVQTIIEDDSRDVASVGLPYGVLAEI